MKKLLVLHFFIVLLGTQLYAADDYQYILDLTNVKNDKVHVELIPPKLKENTISFYFPKMIPGTYAIEDYGRMISDFKAFDKKGNELQVEKSDANTWVIHKAKKLMKISYWVEDTYDTQLEGPEIFQPAGTNIEANTNFIINSSGYFGFFEGLQKAPITLSVIKPEGFYGATGLKPTSVNAKISSLKDYKAQNGGAVDVFTVNDYDKLVDSPIMYSKPDTATVKVGNTDVLIASYSPTKKINSKEIAASIQEVLMAQQQYLGGELPVDKYAFIFYFTDQPVYSYGALEHSYSSFYFMPEMTIEQMAQQLRDFAAHEFFHIVTPLTIHSEEIENFNFHAPEMSEHLWLYEGMTEYFAGNMQVKYGLITKEEYLKVIREKMITASQFIDSVAFTTISKNVLDKYEDQYYNVYQKGALIGMCLDIELRDLSGGKYGVQDLMKDLSTKYGKNKAFKDDELFTAITELTYPEIGEFLSTYVAGTAHLPYAEEFKKVGIAFSPEEIIKTLSLGIQQANLSIANYEDQQYLAITNAENLNPMGDSIGFENGDIIFAINGDELPPLGPDLGNFIVDKQHSLKVGETITYTVLREDKNGGRKKVKLYTTIFEIEQPQLFLLQFDPNATPDQIKLRNFWLEP